MTAISNILILVGIAVMIIGSFGILRLPDIYSRLQASSASDTGGVLIVLLGFLIRGGLEISDIFLGLLILFFFMTGPIVTHTIAKAAFLSKIEPSAEKTGEEER